MNNFILFNSKAMKPQINFWEKLNLSGRGRLCADSKEKNDSLTYAYPKELIKEINLRLSKPVYLKVMNNTCSIYLCKDLFVDVLVGFIKHYTNIQDIEITFSTYARNGVLRLTGIPKMDLLKEEFLCFSSMMKLFDGFAMSDNSSLTLVFQMRTIFD